MKAKIDFTGKVFGRLTVIKEIEKRRGNRYFMCQCSCGETSITQYGSLTTGDAKSCGCLNKEIVSNLSKVRSKTHGMSKTNIYKVWRAMKNRCYYLKDKGYKDYGARGITVSNEWRESFENFFKDMGIPQKGMQVDRIDNSKGYSKENCKWSTKSQNIRNRRNSIILPFKGVPTHIEDIAKQIGIKPATLRFRLRKGWTINQIINEPLHAKPSLRSSNR